MAYDIFILIDDPKNNHELLCVYIFQSNYLFGSFFIKKNLIFDKNNNQYDEDIILKEILKIKIKENKCYDKKKLNLFFDNLNYSIIAPIRILLFSNEENIIINNIIAVFNILISLILKEVYIEN